MRTLSQWVRRAILGGLLIFITATTAVLLLLKLKGDQIRRDWLTRSQEIKILEEQAKELNKFWKLGDTQEFFKAHPQACDEVWGKLQVPPELNLRCHPGFIECILRQMSRNSESIKVSTDHGFSEVEVIPWESGQTRPGDHGPPLLKVLGHQDLSPDQQLLPGIGLQLKIKNSNHLSLLVYLENNCHEVYLPQRYYPYGLNEKFYPQQTWDNFGRTIFVDRFLVSRAEVARWKRDLHPQQQWDFATPALNLTREEQENFCLDQGKRLLSAQLLDAHSFYPRDPENPKAIPGRLADYPWEMRPGEFKGQLNCQHIFAQDCKQSGQTFHSLQYSGWAELYHLSGGPFESVDNWMDQNSNLKLSSYYSPPKSQLHHIGIRGEWDGQGFSLSAIKAPTQILEDIVSLENDIQIGFRCYREVPNDF